MLATRRPKCWVLVLGLSVLPLGRVSSQEPDTHALPILPGATWRYFKGVEEPPADWHAVDFDDSSWLEGPTGIGYGVDENQTVLDDMRLHYVSVYARHRFEVPPEGLAGLRLEIVSDDAFVAYINGTEVFSNLYRPSVAFDETPYESPPGDKSNDWVTPQSRTIVLDNFLDLLVVGTNVIAIQGHNDSKRDGDFVLLPTLGRPRDVLLNTKHFVDCNGNDVPDFVELAADATRDCNRNGVPDECDARGGNFAEPILLATPTDGATRLAVTDIDGDATLDLVLSDPANRELFALLGNGAGDFPLYDLLATRVAVGEVIPAEIDGAPGIDLVVVGEYGTTARLTILSNDGRGGFLKTQSLEGDPARGFRGLSAVVEDLDGDGARDIASFEPRVGFNVYLNDGSGFFLEGVVDPIEAEALEFENCVRPRMFHLRALDVDGDADLDLLAALGRGHGRTGEPFCFLVLTNDGSGRFQLARHLELPVTANQLTLVDLNGDLRRDYVVAREGYFRSQGVSSSRVTRKRELDVISVSLNTGDGVPSEAVEFSLPHAVGVQAFDADGDGDLDLVGASAWMKYVAVFFNRGDGTFNPRPATVPLKDYTYQLLAGDFDEDGLTDLVAVDLGRETISILFNQGGPTDADANLMVDACKVGFLRGDCDGDGRAGGTPTDAVAVLSYNFLAAPQPPCLAACDADGDGRVVGTVTDAIYLLSFSFLGGPRPPEPFPECRAEFAGALGCEVPQCP